MGERLEGHLAQLQNPDQVDNDAAREWDLFKASLRKDTLLLIRQRRRSCRASLTQKLKRLLRQECRLMETEGGVIPTVETITDSLAAMSLATGTGETPLKRVRNAITECIRAKFALRGRQRFWTGAYTPGKSTKQLFRKVNTKFTNHGIHRLDAASGTRERGVHDKADMLADAWAPIFQQPRSTEEDRAEALTWLGPAGQYSGLLSGLDAPITTAEVAAAIGASKPGKACGPDGFGNDWYRDFSDDLVPILTLLYNRWMNTGSFPQSFLEADICCLSKGGDTKNPLNYRPLALLDSDYKIYTRVLTSRTSASLRWIIHPNQNGFVPFRVIHDTIDLFRAAKVMAAADPALMNAMAMLLDFRKAYDSVDREFLYQVLFWLGFPARYVATIRGLHEGTRVRFLANGNRSRWVEVQCGIRQGCPLAPLLFILVLEAFYRRIDRDELVNGIVLRSPEGTVTLKVAGYADDTACYVRTVGEVTVILIIARKFAAASGLLLNEEKTMIIALHPDVDERQLSLPSPLRVQAATHLARYLGIQVGSHDGTTETWHLARRQLTARLALATEKTMTVDQRSLLAAAIIIPKLMYIGRHCWPTVMVVNQFQKMIKNFVWHAQLTPTPVAGRAWLNTHVAQLPRRHGGIALPDLKTEL
ncbi:hypothetical protein PF003_g16145 [Phytophthora fragariae]|nr:hypothetical protein PF003_g16145 [Phytophthora fragariae]